MLERVQRGLEQLYRLSPAPDVRQFLISDEDRTQLMADRHPPEQLLIQQAADGQLEVGLFLDPNCLANLDERDPTATLDDDNLADLCLAIEGVSHYLYLSFRAGADLPLSALELELQAEVDKYVTCALLPGASRADLRQRLFHEFRLASDLTAEERERYQTANDQASRYAHRLERQFLARDRIPEMLGELRRFYRLGLADKLSLIARAA